MKSTTPSTSRTTSANRRTVVLVLCAILGGAAAAVPAATVPKDVVRGLADQVLAILKDQSLASDAKRQRIEPLVYGAVDFDTLSKLVLARNWSRFSAEEQARFEQEFKRHLSVTYGKSIDSYKNEQVQITGEREEARGDWTVKSKILRGGGDADIAVDYRLRQVNGDWKIIDFVVEGVSLVANFRSQFQDLLASNTPTQLIQLIRDKNEKGESFDKIKKPV